MWVQVTLSVLYSEQALAHAEWHADPFSKLPDARESGFVEDPLLRDSSQSQDTCSSAPPITLFISTDDRVVAVVFKTICFMLIVI